MTTFDLNDLALANVLFACVHFVTSGPKTEPRSGSHHANGFIHLHFRPPVLRLHPGDVTSGRIDVAVHDAADLDSSGSPWIVRIRPCCLDPAIAEVDRSPDDVVLRLDNFRSSSAADVSFQVAVRGLRMGRTALRFYVTKNCSLVTRRARQSCAASGGRHDDDQDPVTSLQRRPRMHSKITEEDDPYGNNESAVESFENEAKVKVNHSRSRSTEVNNDTVASFPGGATIANSSSVSFFAPVLDYYDDDDDVTHNGSDVTTTTTTTGVRWWIPQEYHVIVCRPVDRSTMVWFSYLLMVLTSVNLVGAGGQVDPTEAMAVLRRPTTLAIGLFSRFAVTPVVSSRD